MPNIEPHVNRVQRAATNLLNALNDVDGVSTEIGNLGGQSGIEAYFLDSEGNPRTDLPITLAEVIAALSTFDAFTTLRTQGHGTNLAKLRLT